MDHTMHQSWKGKFYTGDKNNTPYNNYLLNLQQNHLDVKQINAVDDRLAANQSEQAARTTKGIKYIPIYIGVT